MPHLPIGRVVTMAQVGCPAAVIAERLGAAPRHVRRVLAAHFGPSPAARPTPNGLIGTRDEWRLWQHYREAGYSLGMIGYAFGCSRQAVAAALAARELALPAWHAARLTA